jgi:hypothetical protein
MASVDTYVKQKEEAAVLRNAVKNWKRKIEIAEIAAKEHEKIMRKKEKKARMMGSEINE